MGSAIYAKMFKQQLNKDSHEYDHKPAESDVAQAKFINAKMKKMKIDPKLIVDSVKKAAFDKDFNELQAKNKIKEVELPTVKSTLVDEYSFNKSLDNYNKMTMQPGHNSNPKMVKESNDAFKKIENMKAKDSKGNVVSAMSIFIDD